MIGRKGNFISHTTQTLKRSFDNLLKKYPQQKAEVEGYVEFEAMFTCYGPMTIGNILGPSFDRNFHITLLSAINEIKESQRLDKSALYSAILKKYLNIDLAELDPVIAIKSEAKPNAYHSIPSKESEDFNLHLYFLQPFRLFGITDNNRKYIRNKLSTQNREWHWSAISSKCDSAPYFRKIIQVYLLSEILEDVSQKNKDFEDKQIEIVLPLLVRLREDLLKETEAGLDCLIKNMSLKEETKLDDDQIKIEGEPSGLFSERGVRSVDRLLPGFLDIVNFYPIGRLAFGQPRADLHHLIAKHGVGKELDSAGSKIKYLFFWLFSHLNLTTSIFWIKSSLITWKEIWKTYKNYIYGQETFENLSNKSKLIIPSVLIAISSPLLIFLPWLYGLTSIPFTLIRMFLMNAPKSLHFLRQYKLLKGLDIIELLKDIVIFSAYAVPIFTSILNGIAVFIPSIFLSIGAATSFLMMLAPYILFALVTDIRFIAFLDKLYFISSTVYFSFIGISIFIGAGCYFFTALAMRQLMPYIPEWVASPFLRGMNYLSTSFSWMTEKLSSVLGYFYKENLLVELRTIIPESECKEEIVLPQAKFVVPLEREDEVNQWINQLGRLNQSFHLSPKRKEMIVNAINGLQAPDSLISLENAIETARKLVDNNFTQEEANQRMKAVLSNLAKQPMQTQEMDILKKETMGLRTKPTGGYQPSWNIIELCKEKKQYKQTAEGFSEIMLEKCDKISALDLRSR